ncbi:MULTISPECIES: GNAT family N-acetyltransferase [Paenibacillus]|uniref:GNAT family N-acetyltransferase n=1 Tax=Paenibacillus borealis TaxID=160799 RepID=A0ABX3H377_PAEBO|nr:GNAT family N-acetyltransferase [Paenibacillus borealis]OMD43963.1 GNAT family N-acetyltransferase [Paenibacillus borealis]
MEIRQLQLEDFEASLGLSEYAFQFKLNGDDRVKSKRKFKPERVWGIFEEGELSAELTLLPLQVYVQGKAVSMGGIAGVATWPENRRQGLVAKLLSHTLQTMNESGHTLSFLHPFLIPFYRRFGWEIYCEYKKYTIPVGKFPRKAEMEGRVERDKANIEVMEQLYGRFASGYNGTLLRDREWWENSVVDEDTHHCVFYSAAGEPGGYVLYKIENKELVIDEFIFMDEEARRGLWTFLANHDSMVTAAKLNLVPADDMLPFLLPDPRIPQENYPYFMARIVNAKAFVEGLTFKEQSELQKRMLYIEDEHAPWNEGLWEWKVNQQGEASLIQVKDTGEQADLRCGIGTLTVLLLGYKHPEELHRCGQLSGSLEAVEWLKGIMPQARTALFDFF